ncbi:hypothetical protein [Bacillus toyonensis]|uniref:hypothetical protein n=1 Tax=Bacillus toyonensis TaxID=155322 RepID=UPI003D1D7804
MFKFEMTGLDELEKKLKNMEKSAKELDGENYIPFADLFNDSFMMEYTRFVNIDKFFEESKYVVKTDEDFKKIPSEKLDEYVKEVTEFENWEEMKTKAAEIYVLKKLGF